jgi:cobalamin biosynthesis protein CobD/CbiB
MNELTIMPRGETINVSAVIGPSVVRLFPSLIWFCFGNAPAVWNFPRAWNFPCAAMTRQPWRKRLMKRFLLIGFAACALALTANFRQFFRLGNADRFTGGSN